MLAVLASLALLAMGQEPRSFNGSWVYLGDPNSPSTHLSYLIGNERLDPPKY